MNEKTSLIFGSTGFIGSKTIDFLLSFSGPIIAVNRQEKLGLGKQVNQIVIKDLNLSNLDLPNIDHVYICLGTKLRAWELIKMSKKKRNTFIKTDLELVVEVAKKAKSLGAKTISLISAVGVKEGSFNTYMDTKGKVEKEIIKMQFESVNFFRPGHLQGKALTEKWDTAIADFFSKILDFFLFGPFSKFKSIDGDTVAKAMVLETKKSKSGVNYFYFNEMIQSLINATPSE